MWRRVRDSLAASLPLAQQALLRATRQSCRFVEPAGALTLTVQLDTFL